MANVIEVASTAGYGLGVLGIAGFIFSFLRYSNYKETVQLQNDNIKALQDNALILQRELEKHKKTQTENLRAIARLEGQVDLYKELPLRELADGIKSVSVSNHQILLVLEKSSLIAAEDREALTNNNQHIGQQIVDKQIVKEK